MGVRRACLVVAVVLIPVGARSDQHWAEGYGGVQGGGASVLMGGNASVAVSIPEEYPELRKLALVFDVSKVDGEHDSTDLKYKTFMGGLRRSFPLRKDRKVPMKKIQLYLQGLVGALQTTTGVPGKDEEEDWASAIAFGAGIDGIVLSNKKVSFGFRGQFDFVIPASAVNPFPRLAVGAFVRLETDDH